jgi:molybdopterin converting factor small subunit
MLVSVYLHTVLQRHTPQGIIRQLEVSLPAGSDLTDLLRELQVEYDPEQIMLVVNGVMSDEHTLLADGDRVNLMPAISGGSGKPAG